MKKMLDFCVRLWYHGIRKGKEIVKMTIWLDMDGTMADLYGVENWLEMLTAHDETPYAIARPLVRMATLARLLNNRQREGWRVCVVSALAKNSNADYDNRVMAAKREWLKKHLASVKFDEIRFVPYTCVKNEVNARNDVLFDDEARHLNAWTGKAIPAADLLNALKTL